MVTLGAGATLAGIVGSVPWLVALSKYKVITFSLSGVMLLIAGISIWFSRKAPCPIDAELAQHCQRVRQINYWIYGFAVLLWLVGFFFAFLAIHLL